MDDSDRWDTVASGGNAEDEELEEEKEAREEWQQQLTGGTVHALQGYLAHKKQRPPRTLP